MQSYKQGIGLIEVVIGAAITVTVLLSLTTLYTRFTHVAVRNIGSIKQVFLLEEGVEAIMSLRNESWSQISVLTLSQDYSLNFNTIAKSWSATTSEEVIDTYYTRRFQVESVSRDSNDNIVSSGGVNDPDTRKVTVEVYWDNSSEEVTKSISFYITDLFDN